MIVYEIDSNSNYLYSGITREIIHCFYTVYNELGHGFLEKVYENSLYNELKEKGIEVRQQHPIEVYFRDIKVGQYFADLLVEGKVIIEIKAAENIAEAHEAQLVNYLRGTEIEVGLLLNFGPTPQFKRRVLTKEYKKRHKRS